MSRGRDVNRSKSKCPVTFQSVPGRLLERGRKKNEMIDES